MRGGITTEKNPEPRPLVERVSDAPRTGDGFDDDDDGRFSSDKDALRYIEHYFGPVDAEYNSGKSDMEMHPEMKKMTSAIWEEMMLPMLAEQLEAERRARSGATL
jgi:hypothetical protein